MVFTRCDSHFQLHPMKKEKSKLLEIINKIGRESVKKGTDKLTDQEIQDEVNAVRRERRLKNAPVKVSR